MPKWRHGHALAAVGFSGYVGSSGGWQPKREAEKKRGAFKEQS